MLARGRWFLVFFVISAASGAFVIYGLTPVMKEASDLGRALVFLLGIGISAAFSVAIIGFVERLRGDDPEDGP